MATVKGIVTFTGTIDGINFYVRKGVPTARRSGGGFTAEKIKNKASMASVRRNNSELGHAAKVNRLLKMSFIFTLLHRTDGTLHARLMGLLLKIKVLDLSSKWGERTVWNGFKNVEGRQLYLDFQFMPTQTLDLLFNGLPVVSQLGSTCSCASLSINDASFKNGATDVKMDYFVVDYCSASLTYIRYEANSCVLSLKELPVTLPDFEIMGLPPTFDFRMAYVSVQFYKCANGKMEVLKGDGMTGLRCLGVYDLGVRS